MKIAIFTDLYLEVAGGIPSSIKAQKASLKALGHQVTVFCPGTTCDDPDVVLIPTSWLKINGAPMGRGPHKIIRFIEQRDDFKKSFDLVHVHYEAEVSLAGMLLARKYKKPLVQTMHGREDMAIGVNVPFGFKTIASSLLNFIHARFIPHRIRIKKDQYLAPTLARAKMWTLMVNHANFADLVLTPSEHFARKLKNYGVKKPLLAVSNGVADSLAERSWQIRKFDGKKPLRIIWNSRASREKRIIPFLQALKLSGIPFKLEVFGGGNHLAKAKRYAKRHNLAKQIKFYGQVPHEKLLEKMQEQHLSATVSYGFDTQGLTLLEAEVTGLPVFFCDPDMAEIVPADSFIMSTGPSPAAMAEALRKLYSTPEQIEAMSKVMLKHRQTALQSVQIKKLLQAYKAIL